MGDREQIHDLLTRVQHRTRADSRLASLARALLATLPIPTLLVLGSWIYPIPGVLIWAAGTVGLSISAAVYVLMRPVHASTLEAAHRIDRRAKLCDTWRTASWFLSQGPTSPWIDLQIHRTVLTIPTVDSHRLFAQPFPKSIYFSISVLVLLPFFYQAYPRFPIGPGRTPLTLGDVQRSLLEQIEENLNLSHTEEAIAARELLKEVQEAISRGSLSAEAAEERFSEMEEILGAHQLNRQDLEAGLEAIATDLAADPQTKDVSEALGKGGLQDAADRLKELSKQLGERREGPLADGSEPTDTAALDGQLESLAQALREFEKGSQTTDTTGAQMALDKAAATLDSLMQQLQDQQVQDMASRQLSQLKNSLGDPQGESDPGEAGQYSQASRQTGMPFQSAEADDQAQQNPQVGGSAQAEQSVTPGQGEMPSTAGGGHQEGREDPGEIQVQLKRELVEGSPDMTRPGQSRSEVIKSRFEESSVPYSGVSVTLVRGPDDHVSKDSIPWHYRGLVQNYFKEIRSGGTRTP